MPARCRRRPRTGRRPLTGRPPPTGSPLPGSPPPVPPPVPGRRSRSAGPAGHPGGRRRRLRDRVRQVAGTGQGDHGQDGGGLAAAPEVAPDVVPPEEVRHLGDGLGQVLDGDDGEENPDDAEDDHADPLLVHDGFTLLFVVGWFELGRVRSAGAVRDRGQVVLGGGPRRLSASAASTASAPTGGVLPGESRGELEGPLGEPLAQDLVGEHAVQGRHHPRHVVEQQPGLALHHGVAVPADAGHHGRRAAGGGLGDRHPPALARPRSTSAPRRCGRARSAPRRRSVRGARSRTRHRGGG